MSFKLENFGADSSNAKSTLGGVRYYRYFNEENNTLTTAGYFPANLGLEVGDRIRVIPAVKTNADELYVVTSTANRTVTVTQIYTDGSVDSVNGKTGQVVLNASDVGALPDSTVIPEAIQVSELPTASADEEGKIYQFTGTTDANYTNGYFYKCVGTGSPATYSWEAVNVQPAPDPLPSQTGQSGKFLTTDGTDASWSDKPLVNKATGTNAVSIIGANTSVNGLITIGTNADGSAFGLAVGFGSYSSTQGCAFGYNAQANSNNSIAIGQYARVGVTAQYAIQLGGKDAATVNSDANTFKVANANGNFEIMSADGTIPAARHAALPAADGTYVLKLVIASGVPTLTWVAE